jgi:hypothetical protein
MSVTPVGAALELGSTLIKRLFPDPEQRAKAELELIRLQEAGELKHLEASMQVIVAEAQSGNWLTSSWRPITMLVFVAIIANNYLLYPYLALFWTKAPMLELPPDLWALLKIGLGGYTVGRSAEKVAKNWKQG